MTVAKRLWCSVLISLHAICFYSRRQIAQTSRVDFILRRNVFDSLKKVWILIRHRVLVFVYIFIRGGYTWLVHFYVVTETVCKNSTHVETFKTEVILSLLYGARIQTSWIRKNEDVTRGTCSGNMYPHFP